MELRRHAGDAAGKNLAAFSNEFFQQFGILVVNGFEGDVDAEGRRGTVGGWKVSGLPWSQSQSIQNW